MAAMKAPVDPTSKKLVFGDEPTASKHAAPDGSGDHDRDHKCPRPPTGDESFQPSSLPEKPSCMTKKCPAPISPESQLHSVKKVDDEEVEEDEEDRQIRKREETKAKKAAVKARAKAKGKAKAKGRPKAKTSNKKGKDTSCLRLRRAMNFLRATRAKASPRAR